MSPRQQDSQTNSQQIEYACGHWHGQAAVWCPTYTRTHRRCAPHFTHYQFRYVVDFAICFKNTKHELTASAEDGKCAVRPSQTPKLFHQTFLLIRLHV